MRTLSARVWQLLFGVVAVFGVLLAFTPLRSEAQLSVRPVQPKTEFFRFKARYTVIATGEVVQFDLVRPVGHFSDGGIFPVVTSNYHVIVIMRIPHADEGVRRA